jgi:methionyl-tRNA formyltransferase
MARYILASRTIWSIEEFLRRRADLPGEWLVLTSKSDLTPQLIDSFAPRFVFFPHWSSFVPNEILTACECVCFHMSDVPFGRGGSPLQNLVSRGFKETKLTALRMTEQFDAGPVYTKRPLDLSGNATEIFRRAAVITMDLVEWIVASEPKPIEQSGEPTFFARRTPAQSEMPADGSSGSLYDHIRMLDAENYPRAFADYGNWRMEFSHASIEGGTVVANVKFSNLSKVRE